MGRRSGLANVSTYECSRCGSQFSAEREPVCPVCMRGRTRQEIEADVLVALITIDTFRARRLRRLRPEDFTVAAHRDVLRALHEVPRRDRDEWLARIMGCSVPDALDFLMHASPVTYEADARWLEANR